jgi:hypothetical protein
MQQTVGSNGSSSESGTSGGGSSGVGHAVVTARTDHAVATPAIHAAAAASAGRRGVKVVMGQATVGRSYIGLM